MMTTSATTSASEDFRIVIFTFMNQLNISTYLVNSDGVSGDGPYRFSSFSFFPLYDFPGFDHSLGRENFYLLDGSSRLNLFALFSA